MMGRRAFSSALAALAVSPATGRTPAADAPLERQFAALERDNGGRLGVAIHDYNRNRSYAYRGDERFALCSTHKMLTAADILARVDAGRETLARAIPIQAGDTLSYSPVTKPRIGTTMTVAELCAAAVTMSDNGAANLLLDSVGGPAGLTAFVRSLGDPVTRLDRREPELNDVAPGDPRDTTSPKAMIRLVQRLVIGNRLSPASRQQLIRWLVANTTGDKRIRAGVPAGWTVGDKTGSGDRREINDVAILWPPHRRPLLVAAYYTGGSAATADERGRVLAEIGRIASALVD